MSSGSEDEDQKDEDKKMQEPGGKKSNFISSMVASIIAKTQNQQGFFNLLIINADAKWKSFFDIWILLLVGYSCFTSLYYVAFDRPSNKLHRQFDSLVEYFFYTDFAFNFLQEYKDTDTHEYIREIKRIALNYFAGWFAVDFVSIFPFDVFFSEGAVDGETGSNIGGGIDNSTTKLVRLARLPRLIKLIDIQRFSKVLKSFQTKDSDAETIVKQYFILYMYNIFRLIVIALMITYFVGCILFFLSASQNPEDTPED